MFSDEKTSTLENGFVQNIDRARHKNGMRKKWALENLAQSSSSRYLPADSPSTTKKCPICSKILFSGQKMHRIMNNHPTACNGFCTYSFSYFYHAVGRNTLGSNKFYKVSIQNFRVFRQIVFPIIPILKFMW